MLVFADIGHQNKPARLNDRGVVKGDLVEVEIANRYVRALDRELRRLGHTCIVGGVGAYEERWAMADRLGADIYLQAHVNAGGGDRGEVFWDYRSLGRGSVLAELIAEEMAERVPWPVIARRCHPDDDGEPRDEDYGEAFGCIKGVKAVAVLTECYFVDGPQVGWFAGEEGVNACGIGIARGIHAWGSRFRASDR